MWLQWNNNDAMVGAGLAGGEFWGANRELELEKGASRGRSQQISVAWQLWQQAPGTGVLFLKAEVCSDCSAELLSPGLLTGTRQKGN